MNIIHIFTNLSVERLDFILYYHYNIIFIALIDLRYISILYKKHTYFINVSFFFFFLCHQETGRIECFKDKMSVSGFG